MIGRCMPEEAEPPVIFAHRGGSVREDVFFCTGDNSVWLLEQQKKTIRVTIFGEEYPLRGEADTEYMQRVAEYVDRSMRSVAEKAGHLSAAKIAVLAAINIADELFRERSDSQKQLLTVEEKAHGILEWLDARLSDESSA